MYCIQNEKSWLRVFTLQDPLFPLGPWQKARTTRVLIAIALYAICPETFLCKPLIRRVRHWSCLNPKRVAAAPRDYALTATSHLSLRFTRPPLEPRSNHPTTTPVVKVPADPKTFAHTVPVWTRVSSFSSRRTEPHTVTHPPAVIPLYVLL